MPLSKEAYQALENIVGAENISEDPAVLDSYAFQWLAETVRPQQSKFMIRPEAALVPGSTEEVQAIVRTCNRYRIKVKPYSTGWYFYGAPQSEGVIQLDMRRMNRIIEIDKKNMFAVVEPYVIFAQLQAEAMKVGLNCLIIGAGASTSTVAGSACYSSRGPAAFFMGPNTQNLLALEWVMPNGDILKTGSWGSGDGYFCGEGPGPSLRGIVRGAMGARGGLGVITKVALKLAPWPGPPVMPVEGTVPAYQSPLSENFRAYTLAFPSYQALAEAAYKIFDAEAIGYVTHRQFNMFGHELSSAFWMMYIDPTKQLDDIEQIAKRPEIQELIKETRYSFEIVLAGLFPGDIEYQEKVLDNLLADTGGHKVTWAGAKEAMERFTLLYLIKMGHKNLNFALVGGYMGSTGPMGTPDYVVDNLYVLTEGLEKYQKTGWLVTAGNDAMMGGIGADVGGGAGIGLEQFSFYDPHDKESVKGEMAYMKGQTRYNVEHGVSPGKEFMYQQIGMTKEELEAFYAKSNQPSVYNYQWKIKQAIDPNDLGDKLYHTLPPK